jgi:hypothetical protein
MSAWNGIRMREGSTSSSGGGGRVGVNGGGGGVKIVGGGSDGVETEDELTEDDMLDDIKNTREDKRRKRINQGASGLGTVGISTSGSPNRTPTNTSFRDRDIKGKGKEFSSLPSKDARSVPYSTDAALRKRKNQRLASQEKKEARREKMLNHGVGGEGEGLGAVEFGHDVGVESEVGDSESLSSLPEDSRSDQEKMNVDEETKR